MAGAQVNLKSPEDVHTVHQQPHEATNFSDSNITGMMTVEVLRQGMVEGNLPT